MPTIKKAPAKKAPVKAAPKAAKPATADKTEAKLAFAESVALDRSTANKQHAAFDPSTVSIPVKSFAAFKRTYKRDVTAHAIARRPSVRQAAALTYGALAAGKTVADKTTFARRFNHNGRELAIENGALSDAISAGLCTYNGKTDEITITNAAEIQAKIGTFTALA